jgi:16S rRNA U1498 N3-methylase RsmE
MRLLRLSTQVRTHTRTSVNLGTSKLILTLSDRSVANWNVRPMANFTIPHCEKKTFGNHHIM